jgi:predicted RNase H-like nuclease (RuvC/YqgF family)
MENRAQKIKELEEQNKELEEQNKELKEYINHLESLAWETIANRDL